MNMPSMSMSTLVTRRNPTEERLAFTIMEERCWGTWPMVSTQPNTDAAAKRIMVWAVEPAGDMQDSISCFMVISL